MKNSREKYLWIKIIKLEKKNGFRYNKNSKYFPCPINRNNARCGNGNDFSEILSWVRNRRAKNLVCLYLTYTKYIQTYVWLCALLNRCCLNVCTECIQSANSVRLWGYRYVVTYHIQYTNIRPNSTWHDLSILCTQFANKHGLRDEIVDICSTEL